MPLTASIGAIVFGLVAGGAFVFQQAVNASLRGTLHSAAWSGFVSYLGGTLCMLLLAGMLRDPMPTAAQWTDSAGWGWTGGLFGAIYVAISILLVPRIGTAAFLSLFVAGQMACSLVIDRLGAFGVTPHALDAPRLIGAVLVVAGVVLIGR